MDFPPDPYQYPSQPPPQQILYHPSHYPPYLQHPQRQFDEFYMPYSHQDYTEFVTHGPYQDDYEDVGEVATRPRLTKEQVGVLEAQFQANHKPNSTMKRQLAIQTNLSLPRVANWFQNRRAKAKQLKKQEEFETNQSLGLTEGSRREGSLGEDSTILKDDDDQASDDENFPSNRTPMSDVNNDQKNPSDDASKDAGWASLQRALNAAKAANSAQQHSGQSQMMHRMLLHETTRGSIATPPYVGMRNNKAMEMPHLQSFSRKHSWADAWASHQVFQDQSFDFDFESQATSTACPPPVVADTASETLAPEQSIVSPDAWQDGLPTPRGTDHQQMNPVHEFQSSDFPLPLYPGSRRGSAADSLTNNFDAFALANDSPHAITTPVSSVNTEQPEGPLDLAARRKRPRPAALTSASLRSRSYGAMTSMSPTFRPSMTPTLHTVRHVKSTGHSLNVRYGGIRKPSSAQRSPMNFATFAEAEAFDRLMVQQAAATQATMPVSSEASGCLLSPAHIINSQAHGDHGANPMAHKLELASRYQLPTTQHLTLMTASPPVTPFTAEFDPPHAAFAMPPISAPPQYATFPDYTPPYSAGPLTNSSWSDAPLTSPDLPNFPPVTYVPIFGHPQKSDSISGHFSEFVLASDSKSDLDTLSSISDSKKPDFFIQEFPNQKEEHANVARQIAQHKPKNYVFANTAPSDYDQA